jgi:hypothetical protein
LIEATVPISNPFEKRCRQQTDIAELCLAVNAGLLQVIETLQERSGPRFGEQLQYYAVLRLDQMGGYLLKRGNIHPIPIAQTPTQQHAKANEVGAPATIRSDQVVEMLAIFERRLRIVPDDAAQPSVTYVDRAHLNIERTLEQAIDVPNQIVSLAAGCKWIMRAHARRVAQAVGVAKSSTGLWPCGLKRP